MTSGRSGRADDGAGRLQVDRLLVLLLSAEPTRQRSVSVLASFPIAKCAVKSLALVWLQPWAGRQRIAP